MPTKINDRAEVVIKNLIIAVRITDTREIFGRSEYLVTPVAGRGQQWMKGESLMPITVSQNEPARAEGGAQ